MATVLDLSPIIQLTHEQSYQLCLANRDVAMERLPKGKLIIVTPVGGESGSQEASLIVKVGVWNEQTGLGVVFSSSTIFNLPNGGDRSPDVAWVKRDRWEALTQAEREKFPPICPDFVIEGSIPFLQIYTHSVEAWRLQSSGVLTTGWGHNILCPYKGPVLHSIEKCCNRT